MLKQTIVVTLLLFISFTGFSQQQSLFSQYMQNAFVFNSAMAGHDGYSKVDLSSRQQWLGFDNAPRTFSLSGQTRLLFKTYMIKRNINKGNKFIPGRSGRIGLGVNIFSDRNGYFEQSGISMAYAYHIPLHKSQLSLGFLTSMKQFKIYPGGIKFKNNDILAGQLSAPLYIPDIDVGAFYEASNYYGGLSVTNILQSEIKYGNKFLNDYQMKRLYYIIAGYRYTEYIHLVLEPTVLIKTTEAIFPQVDFSFKATYYDNYWAGLSYRTGNALIMFMGIAKNNLSAGYSFDYSFNALQKFSYGSHEIMLELRFGDSARRYRWVKRY